MPWHAHYWLVLKEYILLTCKGVKEMPADMGQADVGTISTASEALNLLRLVTRVHH